MNESLEGERVLYNVRHIVRMSLSLAQLQHYYPQPEALRTYWGWDLLYFVCAEWPFGEVADARVGRIVTWLAGSIDVNAYSQLGNDFTPLLLAVRRSHVALVHALLYVGADPNRETERITFTDHVPVAQWTKSRWTVLDEAIRLQHTTKLDRNYIICLLLDRGARNPVNALPKVALRFLARRRQLRAICLMLLMHHRRRLSNDAICSVDRHVWLHIVGDVWATRLDEENIYSSDDND
jgi:hypothetical protein